MPHDLTCILPDGKLNIRVSAWIEQEGRLLVSVFPDQTMSLPGGRVHFSEDSQTAIRREIFEETGEVFQDSLLFAVAEIFFSDQTPFHEILFVYKGTLLPREHYVGADEANQSIIWLPLDQVDQLKPACFQTFCETPDTTDILHIVNIDESLS